jgi:hypothetical protein
MHVEAVVITDDELRFLETRFGPCVRQMGSWCTDGTFGYSSVATLAVARAVGSLENPSLGMEVSKLEGLNARAAPFIELLETFGPALVERIVAG